MFHLFQFLYPQVLGIMFHNNYEYIHTIISTNYDVFQSPPIKNLSYIKNITALEVVKSLYKLGNIDSDLNPTVKNIDRELHDVNLFPYWRDEDDANLRGSGSSFNVVSLNVSNWRRSIWWSLISYLNTCRTINLKYDSYS